MGSVSGLVAQLDARRFRAALCVFGIADDDVGDVSEAALFDIDVVANVLALALIRIDRSDPAHLRGHVLGLHEGFLTGRLANGWSHAVQLSHKPLDVFEAALSHLRRRTSAEAGAKRGRRPCPR